MKPGARVGRYVIVSLLGQGGMGQVYRAYDEVLRRHVAIKLLRASPGEPTSENDSRAVVRRILREARSAAALTHANVIAIHDVGEHEGTPFIVMELVTGRTLRSIIGGDASIAERLRWLVDVARALGAAHSAGLAHRDVKPENVIVRDDGAVKVLDFGIARRDREPARDVERAEDERPRLDLQDTVQLGESRFAGTPAYMAPEVLRGEPADERVDQFAWGVMAYEVLAGSSPWGPPNLRVLEAILTVDPPALDAAALGVGEDVVRAISRAMQKDPAARFSSMDAVIAAMGASVGDSRREALASVGSVEFVSAPTLLATGGSSRRAISQATARAPRTGVALIAIGACVTVAAIAGVAWTKRAPRAISAAASSAPIIAAAALRFDQLRRLTFAPGCEEFPSLTAKGDAVLFDATVGDEDHLVFLDLATGARRAITAGAGWQYAAALSPDGTRIAYLDQGPDHSGTYLIPADGSGAKTLVRAGPVRPSWSPDGSAVWAGAGDALERVDAKSGATTRRLTPPADVLCTMAIELPDGRVVARCMNRQTRRTAGVLRFDPGADAPRSIYAGDIEETLTLALDGEHVLVARQLPTDENDLWEVPLDGGPGGPVGEGVVRPTKGLALARTGDFAVWSTCASHNVVSFADGAGRMKATPLFANMEWADHDPAGIAGDRTNVVLVSDRGGSRQLWVLDSAGKTSPRALRLAGLEPSSPNVSPDGRRVTFAAKGKGIYVAPLDESAPPRQLTSDAADGEPSFGRGGTTIYFATPDGAGGRAIASVPAAAAGAPVVVVHNAASPSASPAADRLAYVTQNGDAPAEARVLDLRTHTSSPLSPAIGPGIHPLVRYSPDGKRVAVGNGFTEIADLDAARGVVLGTYATNGEIANATYVGARLVVTEYLWRGTLWTARLGSVGTAR